MRLEVGKDYMTRNGERVGIVATFLGKPGGFLSGGYGNPNDLFLSWNLDGSYVSPRAPSPFDLICEWPVIRDRLGQLIQAGSVLVGSVTGRVCVAKRPEPKGWLIQEIEGYCVGDEWVIEVPESGLFEVIGNAGRQTRQ